MRYIDSWLTGLGLEYIIPKLKANGITTPKKLALLTLRDMYEVVGVEDAEDRKKLYFLIQRLHTILNNKPENLGSPGNDNDDELPENTITKSPPKTMRVSADNGAKVVSSDRNEEDLRVLRRNRRSSIETAESALSSPKQQSLSENDQGGVPYEIKSSRNSKSVKDSNLDSVETSMREVNLREVSDSKPTSASGLRVKKSFAPPLDPPPPSPPREQVPTQSARRLDNNGRQRATKPAVSKYEERSPPASPPRVPPPPVIQRNPVVSAPPNRSASTNESKAVPAGKQSRLAAPPPPPVEPEYEEEDDLDDGSIVDMAIRVVVRKRPMSRGELNKGDRDVMDIARGGSVMVHEPKTKVDLTKVIETQKFTFDDAFDADETNEVIYSRTIKHLVSFVFDGGKASCFAYGQTGSGKTFSMMGSRPDAPAEATENAGLYVLAARDIFSYVKRPKFQHIKILVSCFEIYGGKLYDLLNNRGIVKCLEDSKQQVQLPGLTEHLVKNVGELLELMAQAHTQRSTGCTGANAESSRSHQVMQIVLRDSGAKPVAPSRSGISSRATVAAAPPSQRSPGGKLSFIDLAGSERGADTTHNSKQTRMEGAEINTSLLALKEVIRSLERKHGHTPFRGSKLTQVLKDSFVGDKTRTCMVACVSPSHSNCEHTLNTLRYADRVKEHQSGGNGGGGGAAAHVSSSQYDSMAYDYVPPAKGSQSDAPSRPQTANAVSSGQNRSVASSSSAANIGKPKAVVAAPTAAAVSRLQQPGSKPRPLSVQQNADVSGRERATSNARPASGGKQTAPVASKASKQQQPSSYESDTMSAGSDVVSARETAAQQAANRRRLSVAAESAASKQSQQRRHEDADSSSRHKPSSIAAAAVGTNSQTPVRSAAPKHHSGHSNRHGVDTGSDEDEDVRFQHNTAAGYAPPEDDEDEEEDDEDESDYRPHNQNQREDEEEEDGYYEQGVDGLDGTTELIQKTVGLLSAHKLSIAEMVEVMKEEMELVQEMENVDDRDSELYIDKLDRILRAKNEAIGGLRAELGRFQKYRAQSLKGGRY